MQDAQNALAKGDLGTARECLIGLNRDKTVYRELQLEVCVIFANGFLAVMQPALDKALQDVKDFEPEVARMQLQKNPNR